MLCVEIRSLRKQSDFSLDVGDGDTNLQVRIISQGENVLFNGLANRRLVESACDFPLHLHAYLPDVRHWLLGS